jgi:hypothetical protein
MMIGKCVSYKWLSDCIYCNEIQPLEQFRLFPNENPNSGKNKTQWKFFLPSQEEIVVASPPPLQVVITNDNDQNKITKRFCFHAIPAKVDITVSLKRKK